MIAWSAHRAVRLVLLWILAAALPLQGLAASAMAGCAAGHGQGRHGMVLPAPAAAQAWVQAEVHRQAHAGHEPAKQDHLHHHAHPHQQDPAPAASSEAVPVSVSVLHSGEHGSCSVCAACCTGAALLPAPLLIASPPMFSGIDPVAFWLAVAFVTDAPERPPRAQLA